MKKVLIALVLVALVAAPAFAEKVYTYADGSSIGSVSFDHTAHSKIAGGCDNAACHGDAGPGPLEVTKDLAHGAMCKDCHKANGGPTGCKGCHVK